MARASAYSPTRLAVFQDCARRYYYRYVIKLPTRRSAEQSVGISLHAALEEVQRAGGVARTGLDGAMALLAARWEATGFASPEDEAAARAQAQAHLATYLTQETSAPGETVLIEQKLEGTYRDVTFRGIVDRVDRLPDGSLELVDYKSGRQGITTAVRQQLAIYRFLVGEKLGTLPVRAAIHQLTTATSLSVELGDAEWTQLLDRAAQGARAIEAEQDFDPRVGDHCARCDFQHRCQAYQRTQR